MASIVTGVVAVFFALSQWLIPFGVKKFLQRWGDWPVKVEVTSATFDNREWLKVRYEIRPRPFTVTERHSPRAYRVEAIVKGQNSKFLEPDSPIRTFDSLEENLDEVYEDGWVERWRTGHFDDYGPPMAVRISVHAGYRHSRRVDIESGWRNVVIAEPE